MVEGMAASLARMMRDSERVNYTTQLLILKPKSCLGVTGVGAGSSREGCVVAGAGHPNRQPSGDMALPHPQPETTAGPTVIDLPDLSAHVGRHLGHSSWRRVRQDDITAFAALTGDDQWIHVDPERAATGPFGTTVAHGYFTLSLSTIFIYEVVEVTGANVILNYGSNRVRYPAPLPANANVRAAVELATVEEITGGSQVVYKLTYEVEGGSRPCCVAEIVFRYYRELPGKPARRSPS
jgi:acyl dehydratase